jgi:hypothetical protein
VSAHGSLRERKPPTAKMRKRSAAVRQERAAANHRRATGERRNVAARHCSRTERSRHPDRERRWHLDRDAGDARSRTVRAAARTDLLAAATPGRAMTQSRSVDARPGRDRTRPYRDPPIGAMAPIFISSRPSNGTQLFRRPIPQGESVVPADGTRQFPEVH